MCQQGDAVLFVRQGTHRALCSLALTPVCSGCPLDGHTEVTSAKENEMHKNYKRLTDFLLELGTEQVGHTDKTYLAHVVGVYRDMEERGCTEELCRGRHVPLDLRHRAVSAFRPAAGPSPGRAHPHWRTGRRLAYFNCAMDRSSFDKALRRDAGPYRIVDRLSGEEVEFSEEDFTDLCSIHLYDWLEQVPRSRQWDYRREAYRQMAARLGGPALEAYDRVFAAESS